MKGVSAVLVSSTRGLPLFVLLGNNKLFIINLGLFWNKGQERIHVKERFDFLNVDMKFHFHQIHFPFFPFPWMNVYHDMISLKHPNVSVLFKHIVPHVRKSVPSSQESD